MPTSTSKRTAAKKSDKELAKQVVAELKGGAKLSDVAANHNITPGKAAFLRMCAEVKPKDRIKADSDEQLAKKIKTARDSDKLSWGAIAARASVPEGKVKRLYESVTGNTTKGLRLPGKGGRSTTAAKKTAAKPKAKPAAKKTAKAKPRAKRTARRTRPSTAA